jgi:hypothetical protein
MRTARAATTLALLIVLGSLSNVAADDTRTGLASTYGPGYAIPEGPGHLVSVCGPADCITRTSNDAGPSLAMQRAGRVVDLNVADFEQVCGCAWTAGLVRVRVTIADGYRAEATLPPSDTEGK